MGFELKIRGSSTNGTVSTDNSGITIKGASEAVLLLSAATSFNGFDKCPDSEGKDEHKLATDDIENAARYSFGQLRSRHQEDYNRYFNRVALYLGGRPEATSPYTDERLRKYAAGAKDTELEMIYFQFARYLLISSSRLKGVPANLQGIWNKELRAPWSSNYTININTQMNYWAAEAVNLSEMHLPLLQWINNLAVTGARVAREFYHCNGWVAHHNSDIWGCAN